MMNLKEYRFVFLAVTFGLCLVAVYPTIALVLPSDSSEEFSELWILDAENKTDNYPFVVREYEEYTLFVGVNNHMSNSEYYRVYLKFRNSTQSLPDINNSDPSVLTPLFEYQFVIGNEESWQSQVNFSFDEVVSTSNVMSVGYLTINGIHFPVNSSVNWDSDRQGFFYQLFFELWRYDSNSDQFVFDNRFVGIWLKVTNE